MLPRSEPAKLCKVKEYPMHKIKLINMPFANLSMPSLALTQLKAAVDSRLEESVSVEVIYLNHEFASYLGLDFYDYLTNSAESQNSGLGEWFFRQVAFPDEPNNAGAYIARYFPFRSEASDKTKRKILEYRRSLEQFMESLISKYALDDANIVGFTSMFMQNVPSIAMARKIKERNPEIIAVMGGANCESPMGQVIARHVAHVDYVFSGPGLKSFPDFVEHCINQQKENCDNIKGVLSRKNYIFNSGPEAIGEELSIDVPLDVDFEPFLNAVGKNFPGRDISPVLLFETSRGCWWGERAHCTFCGLNGVSMAYRAMRPELALDQFNYLFNLSEEVSQLEAVDNILPKNYLQDVLPFLETPPNVSIFYEVKADLSEKEVEVLAKARVKKIQPGIESLATSTLKLMRKGTSVFTNLVLLKNCVKYGIEPAWNLLVGFPGEGEEVYKKYVTDLPLLTHLPPPSGVYPVRFDRYSPYFTQAEHYRLDLRPLDFYSLIYPFNEESLSNLAYYFSDQNAGAEYAEIAARWIDRVREKVTAWAESWQKASPSPPSLHLEREGTETFVYDSRAGQEKKHRLTEAGVKTLSLLNQPKRADALTKDLESFRGADPIKEIEFLKESGLIFQEGDKYLSLVIDGILDAERLGR